MHKSRKINRKRHRKKSQTKKRIRRTKTKSRFVGGFRLKIDPSNGWIDKSQEKIILDMKDIVNTYISIETAKPDHEKAKDYIDNIALFS